MNGEVPLLLRGLLIGFSVAIPVGPIALLCIRRTLAWGRPAGIATGLGVAIADASYAAVAAFGLTAISGSLQAHSDLLRLVGGSFLLWLGWKAVSAPLVVPEQVEAPSRGKLAGMTVSTVGLTLTNPITILSFAAIFAGFGFGGTAGNDGAARLVLGVFLGSMAWWIVLSSLTNALRDRLTPTWLTRLSRAAGIVIAVFGVVAIATAIRDIR